MLARAHITSSLVCVNVCRLLEEDGWHELSKKCSHGYGWHELSKRCSHGKLYHMFTWALHVV